MGRAGSYQFSPGSARMDNHKRGSSAIPAYLRGIGGELGVWEEYDSVGDTGGVGGMDAISSASRAGQRYTASDDRGEEYYVTEIGSCGGAAFPRRAGTNELSPRSVLRRDG